MSSRVLPAGRRYTIGSVQTPQGDLAVGNWQATTADPTTPAPVVLAVHGITGNHRCWPMLADSLKGHRIIAPDLRGRGRSSTLDGPYGMVAHAEDLIRILDAQGLEAATLVGHSMGAFVTLVAAHRYPDRVKGLILVDGGLPMTREIPDNLDDTLVLTQLRSRLETTFAHERDAVAAWRAHPAFLHSWSPVMADYAVYDLGGERPQLRSRARLPGLVADSRDIMTGTAHRVAIEELTRPVQWLTASRGLLGEQPGLYPLDLVLHWRERYPLVAVHPVPDVNHYTIVLSRSGSEAIAAAVLRSAQGNFQQCSERPQGGTPPTFPRRPSSPP